MIVLSSAHKPGLKAFIRSNEETTATSSLATPPSTYNLIPDVLIWLGFVLLLSSWGTRPFLMCATLGSLGILAELSR